AGPAPTHPPATGPRPTIRVDIDRVDRLVDILGELVIHQAMLTEAIGQSPGYGSAEVDRSLDQLRQLSRQIQESVMAIRAQPVKPLFDRMHRIVREASMAAGKTALLVTEGETTEVDKTIIERLADPLTHMIRNAVDHGLEKPPRRLENGKPAEGVIRLSAAHRSGRIVITVQDDGAGIDRDKVRQIAVEKGLVSASADLSPQEIDALLFLPGFSTATEVSALSGRGVGMDVVRSEIAGLGGRVGITSVRGQGTTLTISLPLTLAVLDGMVFEVAGQTLVLPVSTIIETLRPEAAMRHNLCETDSVLDVRGRCLPLIDVGTALGFRRTLKPGEGEIVVVVERGDDGAIALMVDGIRDQRQVVIKGLEANYGQIPGIAAATVLGDGSVALILDPADLASASVSLSRPSLSLAAE
nr:chemotaxis protein CheA [Cypionkella sp.]